MTPAQILNALAQHLLTLPDCPPVGWPNKKLSPLPEPPYLLLQMASRRTIDPTLTGTCETSSGRVVVLVVHKKDAYSFQADELAEAVKQHFRKGPLGDLTIKLSQVLGGYPTDTDWRVPVAVGWTT
ncbi:phage tail terminator-like protein [Thalassobius sp. S69A]|uniref:phage tail terminator-like protein n=1 Tax=unclassified Thalassovita TaxID=2619711 RepID=UPI003C7DC56F